MFGSYAEIAGNRDLEQRALWIFWNGVEGKMAWLPLYSSCRPADAVSG
jgi:hypothetical protein